MSRPIDIPAARPSRRLRPPPTNNNPFPYEDGPFFGYIEIFESGDVCWMVSTGCGKFVEVKPQRSLPALAFIVEKNRLSREIVIEVTSLSLRQAIIRSVPSNDPKSTAQSFSFESLLNNYDALNRYLQFLDMQRPIDDAREEMRLLVCGLLQERALFEGIGLQKYKQRGVLHMTHIQDIHQRSLELGLDEIEDCFILGLMPDDVNERYMEAFNTRFADLARTGNHAALHDLCEPAIRSGEIEIQYNPSLLLEVLDLGHLDTYVYLLDLVDRTRENTSRDLDSDLPDISFEPMYIAIRLGHLDVVESFISESVCFEGRVCNYNEPTNGHVFTPLSSAVFWRQPEILRLLLREGTIYLSGYQQAAAMALANNSQDMIQILVDYEQQLPPRTPLSSYPPSTPMTSLLEMERSVCSPYELEQYGKDVKIDIDSEPDFYVFGTPTQRFERPALDASGYLDIARTDCPGQQIDHHTRSQAHIQDHDVGGSTIQTRMNEGTRNQTETTPKLAKEKLAHKSRRELGQNFVAKLNNLAETVRGICGSYEMPTSIITALENTCFSADSIWSCGINVFRRIAHNVVPSSLNEIIACLMVAEVLISQLSSVSSKVRARFVDDLGRWRSIVSNEEQYMFDLITSILWPPDGASGPDTPPGSSSELYYFQELIQILVSLNKPQPRIDRKHQPSGVPLRRMQAENEFRKGQHIFRHLNPMTDSSFQNIDLVLGRLSMECDKEDDFDIGDFIHLEDLETEAAPLPSTSLFQELLAGLQTTSGWKNTDPAVVMLLASVAFCVILILVSGYPDKDLSSLFEKPISDYGRSCAVIEKLFDFHDTPLTNPSTSASSSGEGQGSVPPSTTIPRRAGIAAMKAVAAKVEQTRPFIQSLGSAASVLYPPIGSSIDSFNGSSSCPVSTSPEVVRSSDRLPCLSSRCLKTFSSISNRNKHMREGCVYREKKGYRCRNGDCTKILTTKWYRNTHEQTRCRFRQAGMREE